jgi:hypothetical protein
MVPPKRKSDMLQLCQPARLESYDHNRFNALKSGRNYVSPAPTINNSAFWPHSVYIGIT